MKLKMIGLVVVCLVLCGMSSTTTGAFAPSTRIVVARTRRIPSWSTHSHSGEIQRRRIFCGAPVVPFLKADNNLQVTILGSKKQIESTRLLLSPNDVVSSSLFAGDFLNAGPVVVSTRYWQNLQSAILIVVGGQVVAAVFITFLWGILVKQFPDILKKIVSMYSPTKDVKEGNELLNPIIPK
jgi:hypothetical protein